MNWSPLSTLLNNPTTPQIGATNSRLRKVAQHLRGSKIQMKEIGKPCQRRFYFPKEFKMLKAPRIHWLMPVSQSKARLRRDRFRQDRHRSPQPTIDSSEPWKRPSPWIDHTTHKISKETLTNSCKRNHEIKNANQLAQSSIRLGCSIHYGAARYISQSQWSLGWSTL